jgi:cytochrome c551/c552
MPDLTVTLSQDDWLKALNVIADGKFKEVAALMQNIQRQLQGQMEPQQPMPPNPKAANGELQAPGA